jgi:GTP-binding protein Era
MSHKAGFVNIIGNPNVGKSTLFNALVGEKLGIISPKASTTRHRILGILNTEEYQVVFSDTPGIIKPAYKLHEEMMRFVDSAVEDADVLVYMTEPGQHKSKDESYIEKLRETTIPLLIVINKIDLSNQQKIVNEMAYWSEQFPQAEIIPVSALNQFNIEKIQSSIIDKIPECPPYFPKDELTDRTQRFFIAEIIREKVFLQFEQEIPYAVEVIVESFEEEEDIIRMNAVIYVDRESQKAIIIGHQGKAIKRLGTTARKDIEAFVDKHVYIELFVKVAKDWRDNAKELKNFGYKTS